MNPPPFSPAQLPRLSPASNSKPSFLLENHLRCLGLSLIAGVDEAGRGPLAGPVFAAAVILPADFPIQELNDSKRLTPARRQEIAGGLTSHPLVVWSVAKASVSEIDQLNILKATHLAMRRALEALCPAPQFALIDGLPVPTLPCPSHALPKGDALCASIAAASILAKVSRDREMLALDSEFPEYGFASHKGYGTKAHLRALALHGPTPHHRRSFAPVAQLPLPLA